MAYYVRQGNVPKIRHTFDDRRNLLKEELFGEESFEGSYSLLYHRNEPTRVKEIKEVERTSPVFIVSRLHQHLKTYEINPSGDFVTGRIPLMGNDNMTISVSKPDKKMDYIFSHALRDQIIFVQKGNGRLRSMMGDIAYNRWDYIYVPKGTKYVMDYSGGAEFLLIESAENIEIPTRYLNKYGQIKEGVPYYTRNIRHPTLQSSGRKERSYEIHLDYDDEFLIEIMDTDPFDLEGWDGYHFPFAMSAREMSPIVGKTHQPPPVHETFSAKSFMIATFLPRKFDFHERAIPISYYHSNVDTDEFLYYSSGSFMSRKGIREGSITLHVRGLVHGPQPDTVEKSIGKEETDEIAVMVESYGRIGLTPYGQDIKDENYMMSWYE